MRIVKIKIIIFLSLLIVSVLFLACAQQQIIPSNDNRSYANTVVSYERVQKTDSVSSVLGKTSFPSKIGHKSLSLGGGWIIVDMGEREEIVDSDGYDLRVYESDKNYDPDWLPETYTVYISNDQVGWHKVGFGRGVTSFDINKTGLKQARYVKIVGHYSDSQSDPGPDIEAIEAINMSKDEKPPEIIISSPVLKKGVTFTSRNESLTINGSIKDSGDIHLFNLNGKDVGVDIFGNFSEEVKLDNGENLFSLIAKDKMGNTSKKSFVILKKPTEESKAPLPSSNISPPLNSDVPIAIKETNIQRTNVVNSDGIAVIIGNKKL